MIRRPPRSTLFPTRRSSDLLVEVTAGNQRDPGGGVRRRRLLNVADEGGQYRSEEHTSELQSQSNLVCRLLLEKKKQLRKPVCHSIKLKHHLLHNRLNCGCIP